MKDCQLSYRFRRAALADEEGCWQVIEQAKRFMALMGRHQWDGCRGTGVAQKYFQEVEKMALAHGILSFKVDTNFDNVEMLHILAKIGFTYCGEITYPQGSRKGFEKLL